MDMCFKGFSMKRFVIKQGSVMALMLLVGSAVGCQGNKTLEERDALWTQNQELQSELSQARADQERAEADRASLSREIDRLRADMNRRPAPAPSQPTGFGGIDGIETERGAGTITVRVPGDVLFASGKVDLKSSALRTLDQIASVISRQYPTNTIRIEGHTDTDPIRKSKWKDNLELSLQRAAAVHRHLQKHGVTPEQMQAVGLGQWHPSGSKAKSRRVEIIVVLN